ncbi:hypothetical protein B0H14DRAFT_3133722 [Mycena olivaceomarginata]|nr:hypothetical protein B0H14DRAFT_3133722 [Mycena olivaceomarginata]
MSESSNTTPPPRSPCRAADDLLDLALQITPSKQPRALRDLRLNLQSRANDLRDDISAMKRRLTDFENQAVSSQHPRKRRKRLNRAADADESIENPNSLEDRTREKGRLFTIQEALFLVDDSVFEVDEDEDFDESAEFTTDKNKIQGQLRQVLRYLPNDAKPFRSTTLVSGAFADGMSGQRSTTSNRLRDTSLAKIVDDIKPFATSSSRFTSFSKLIGYQPGTETCEPFYSKLDAPILYSEWNGQKNVSHLFRNDLLLKIYASLIRGPSGAVGLFDGQSKRPAAKTIERMHRIRCTLPGAITNSAILAIWLHSADTTLTEIGDQTSINYRARHSYYLQNIVEALASNKAWAVDLLAYWDRTLFPDADTPHDADGSAGREIEEDDEDFFGSAQPLLHAQSPRVRSSTSPLPRRLTPSPPSPQRAPAASSSRQERENSVSTSHGSPSRSRQRSQRRGEGHHRR